MKIYGSIQVSLLKLRRLVCSSAGNREIRKSQSHSRTPFFKDYIIETLREGLYDGPIPPERRRLRRECRRIRIERGRFR